MKVFIVLVFDPAMYEYDVAAVFSTQEKAETYAREHDGRMFAVEVDKPDRDPEVVRWADA